MDSIKSLIKGIFDGLTGACFLRLAPNLLFNLYGLRSGYASLVYLQVTDIGLDERIPVDDLHQFFFDLQMHLDTGSAADGVFGQGTYHLHSGTAGRSHLDLEFHNWKNRVSLTFENMTRAVRQFKTKLRQFGE